MFASEIILLNTHGCAYYVIKEKTKNKNFINKYNRKSKSIKNTRRDKKDENETICYSKNSTTGDGLSIVELLALGIVRKVSNFMSQIKTSF